MSHKTLVFLFSLVGPFFGVADEQAHPDPNEEHYDGMKYIGRLHHSNDTRVGFDSDNSVRFIFGTSFDESHKDIEHAELAYLEQHPDDIPDRSHPTQRRNPVMERHERDIKRGRKITPKPFGYVETHPLDGGVSPPSVVRVDPFFLDEKLVTNKQFSQFVKATYYESEAEKFGWSFVLISFLSTDADTSEIEVDPDAPNWVAVDGAYWRNPEGPGSSYKHRENHPVVHISHRDAAEYCKWQGKRLPGEWEWEAAARYHFKGPENRTLFSWGEPHLGNYTAHDDDHVVPVLDWAEEWKIAVKHANLWGQAPFPYENDAADGWRGTSPVATYPPNAAGLYDMTGNVWEWMRGGKHKSRIVRGASYVDSLDGSTNHAATLGAREVVHGTTTTGNIGFRCAKSPQRKLRHHWKWHDEEEHGVLQDHEIWEDEEEIPYHDPDEENVGGTWKKKKVIKMTERLGSEL